MSDEPNDAVRELRDAEDRLADTSALLAEWTACSAENTPSLIERLERMGYAVRGKSREAIADVLKHPPTRKVDQEEGRDEAALKAGAGEAPDAKPPSSPATEVSEPNPTQVGER